MNEQVLIHALMVSPDGDDAFLVCEDGIIPVVRWLDAHKADVASADDAAYAVAGEDGRWVCVPLEDYAPTRIC